MSSSVITAPLVGGVSPNRLGFCQRCGDPISGKIRCSRCGGTSKEPRIRSTQALPAAKKADPWAHRYVNADSSFEPVSGAGQAQEGDEYLHNQPPPLSPKRMNHDPALGFGMPSRISRDLRTSAMATSGSVDADLSLLVSSTTANSSRLSPAPVVQDSRCASQDYSAPVVKGSDGVLSKVCGSLVEPSESRNRWACADCSTVFARDSTLYAAPASLQKHDASYYCRDCYSTRYSLGDCQACGRDVLGSTKEDGKYVKASSGVWHGRCWKCMACSKGGADGADIFVGMDGKPTCEGCFDRPRRAPSAEPPARGKSPAEVGLPDVRRITRVGAARTGAMGATIEELTKKLGQQTASSSPRIPFSSRSSSNTSMPTTSSSKGSLEAPRSPAKGGYAFRNHVPTSPGKTSSMPRSGSFTGSPPKPRPLTAQFRDGMNLAAFKPSFGNEGEGERLYRTDSRSRSVSPVKRPEWTRSKQTTDVALQTVGCRGPEAAQVRGESKVPGSPSFAPVSAANNRIDMATAHDPDRRRTSSGFPLPLHSPFSTPKSTEPSEPLQGDKPTSAAETDLASHLEPAEGKARCAKCHLLPFERTNSSDGHEVVMVTLADDVHLHAECFRCSVCHELIDGSRTFVRLQGGGDAVQAGGVGAYAHPQCSPAVQLAVVQVGQEDSKGGQKSYRASLEPGHAVAVGMSREGNARSHATHQRELKPSPVPSPAASMRTRENGGRGSILPDSSTAAGDAKTASAVRRFQPTAGAAPPMRSTVLSSPPTAASTVARAANPAAGIFSRLTALQSASGNPALTDNPPKARLGGMHNCAFCGEKLSSLESTLGPRGTQWHRTCLVCRAPPPPQPKGTYYVRGKQAPLMCGKRLDSGAKVNGQGEVRCRDCFDRESGAFRIKV
ncbi:hypothetical protein EX895_003538 [Sporisorium graminicola]|uniref:LIM zinc-binding domain-containing protein n=1 Tax=Sporisorium graminicola TaxID=280036 RepID=A0A4U7KSP0_9BASI|nr:hypothetical protein EX895_003538 [Sporisorium graminicola]TKY87524.1 hypothetical protein EX895_003538 [Sporisorium graminicola]